MGMYDEVILSYIERHPGCSPYDIATYLRFRYPVYWEKCLDPWHSCKTHVSSRLKRLIDQDYIYKVVDASPLNPRYYIKK